jgi:hypothetical protein
VRRLTTLIADTFTRRDIPPLPAVPVPVVVRERMNRLLRRRLSDHVMDVLNEACISGDLETAEELLAVLENMHVRRQTAMGDRRLSDKELVEAREEVISRRAERDIATVDVG